MLELPVRPATPRTPPGARPATVAVRVLVPAAVLAQVVYPLTSAAARDAVTIASVLLFTAAATALAVRAVGVTVALRVLAASSGLGFAAEVIGVHTGIPFGHYAYDGRLGPQLLGVPLLVAAAWSMLAWPAAVAARRLTRDPAARVVITAWTLVAWDLFLDPQMTAAGYWRWRDPAPHLPGVTTVPLTNLAGWCVVATAVAWTVQRVMGARPVRGDAWDATPVVWTWAGSVVAGLVFLDLTAPALWAGLGLGAVAVPLLLSFDPVRTRVGGPGRVWQRR